MYEIHRDFFMNVSFSRNRTFHLEGDSRIYSRIRQIRRFEGVRFLPNSPTLNSIRHIAHVGSLHFCFRYRHTTAAEGDNYACCTCTRCVRDVAVLTSAQQDAVSAPAIPLS
jgi:hypothetical protein